jgi:hypothetical protein
MFIISFIYVLSTAFFLVLYWWRMASYFSGKTINLKAWWAAFAFGLVPTIIVYLLWPKDEKPSPLFDVAAVTAVFTGVLSLWYDFVSWRKDKMRRKKG